MLLKSFDPKLISSHALSLYLPSDQNYRNATGSAISLWKRPRKVLSPCIRNRGIFSLTSSYKVAYGRFCCAQFRAKQSTTITIKKGTSTEFEHWIGPSFTWKCNESNGFRLSLMECALFGRTRQKGPLEVVTAAQGGSKFVCHFRRQIECRRRCAFCVSDTPFSGESVYFGWLGFNYITIRGIGTSPSKRYW